MAALVLTACGPVPARAPDIEGHVTSIVSAGDAAVRIEATPGRQSGAKAVVRLTKETAIYYTEGGVETRITPAELVRYDGLVGRDLVRARAWFTGPVRDSYPVQAEAAVLVVWTLAP